MTIQATFPLTLKGLVLAVEDHTAITDRAAGHHHRVVVTLDHGTDDEEYEEVVELYFGSRCFFLIWRDANGVVVQPLAARSGHYDAVPEALDRCGPPIMRKRQACPRCLPIGTSRSCALRRASA